MSSDSPSTPLQSPQEGLSRAGLELQRALAKTCEDRAASGAELVRETAGVLLDWLAVLPDRNGAAGDAKQTRTEQTDEWEALSEALESGMGDLREAQGWRGTVASWLYTIDQLMEGGRCGEYIAQDSSTSVQEFLAEELGLWLGGAGAGEARWNGAPLAVGRRIPDRALCAQQLLGELDRGEVICVHGYSDTVALALEAAGQAGLAPEVVVSEGGPDLGGRRLARRMNKAGLRVRYVYDSALHLWASRADRIWLGTEAVGAEAFLGLMGCAHLCEQARQQGVPVAVLASSDKLLPSGWPLATPEWGHSSAWQLWGDAPEGVRVEAQPYEAVSVDLPNLFISESGPATAADYSLRFLRTAGGDLPSPSKTP
jgi:hypothetical protein